MNIHRIRRIATALTLVGGASAIVAAGTPAASAAISAVTTTSTTMITTTSAAPSPSTTIGPRYAVRSVESGWDHTCALRYDGTVACWGAGSYGRMGTGRLTNQTTAVTIPGLTGVTQLAAGAQHTCALTWAREVFCWGRNDRGQLGDGTTTNRATPVKLALSGVTLLAVGNHHGCAASGSALRCWGANESGQLGTNDLRDRLTPVLVGLAGGDFVTLGAFNSSTCGQITTGLTSCAGANQAMWGNGSLAGSPSFTAVPALSANTARTVIDGSTHRCHAETTTGQVRCVGSNGNGGLGDGTNLTRTTPVSPAGTYSTATAGFANASCGFERVLRQYRCWGSNGSGQLGDGTTTNRSTPVSVKGLPAMTQTTGSITIGRTHTCATYDAGAYAPDRVYCWGTGAAGQLGNGTTGTSTTPVQVQGI